MNDPHFNPPSAGCGLSGCGRSPRPCSVALLGRVGSAGARSSNVPTIIITITPRRAGAAEQALPRMPLRGSKTRCAA